MSREDLERYLDDLRREAELDRSDRPLVIPAPDHIGARKKPLMNS